MEQIQQLIEILKSTPEMALWGISIYFLFILLKLASWVLALKLVIQQFIKRYFDYKENILISKENQLEYNLKLEELKEFHKVLDDSIYGNKSLILKLFMSINKGKRLYSSDIEKAIKILNETPN